ncbi:MAG: glycosyltransferase [candidate division KSB1 bacterium]|jgi:cellulose synthase/poly-beta-1,6-N-acetylglucosamine synthase-like glycosyltransferase|nr:glycosyltransferase [candidate division KSB1 bacterium]
MLIYFLAILLIFYITILISLIIGLFRLTPGKNNTTPFISIIVAARNEEENIGACLNALTEQDYNRSRLEIIIVDDRSTDSTADIVKTEMGTHNHVKLIRIRECEPGMAPKKNALRTGIEASRGEILLFTDADCVPRSGWARSMVRHFHPDVGLVAGFAPLENTDNPTLFTRLIGLDSLALASVAAGSFGLKFPVTCTGRNLAYRKSLYDEIGGFGEIGHMISGDDDLFLHLARRKTGYAMRYAIEAESLVPSGTVKNANAFVNQRVRHASKGTTYRPGMVIGLSAVYVLNLSILILGIISVFHSKFFPMFAVPLLLKSIFEFTLLLKASLIFSKLRWLRYFPIAEILHIPYVVIFALLGQVGKFSWKDDSYKTVVEQHTGAEG